MKAPFHVKTRKKGGAATGARPAGELTPKQFEAFNTPAGFALATLKMPLTPKQAAVMNSLAFSNSSTTTVCCNEAGKTTKMITGLVLWHCALFPRRGENGGIITTSGSWSQIVNQLTPALKSYEGRFAGMGWAFLDTEIKIGGIPNWMAFSVSNVGRAEGFHGSHEWPLMAIVDEAKSVKDEIFRVIEDRCRPQRTGLFSSPGYSLGRFYESHTGSAGHYARFKITVEDCPWIDRQQMERAILKAGGGDREKGLNDPFIRSAYFAEFMPFVEGGILTLAEIEECLLAAPQFRAGDRRAFCDFAAGGDENVLAVRIGNKVWIVDAWRDKNTMSAVGRFVTHFRRLQVEHGLRADEIWGDADGMGRTMVDALNDAGWPVNHYHAESTADDAMRYRNSTSEAWFEGAEMIRRGQIILPDDMDLKVQLTDRASRYESSGRRWIESKPDLFRRQSASGRPQRSPDRADAVLGAMRPGRLVQSLARVAVGMSKDRAGAFSVPEELVRRFDEEQGEFTT